MKHGRRQAAAEALVDYVEDAHAMEQSISKMLDSMISTTEDPEIRSMLEHHKQETEEHERRLRERLDALGAGTFAAGEGHLRQVVERYAG